MKNILRDKYQLIDGLPVAVQGGQGTIYFAKDITSSIDKIYVVKQFTPTHENNYQLQVAKRLFIQEAQILQKLGSHSQIPQIFDYFAENEQFFLVQEWIEGQNLKQELEYKKYFIESETITLLKDTLEVLSFVHQNNYIHRDIKPSNLIRNKYDNKIYLIDFGAVKEKIKPENLDNQGNFTRTIAIGTPGYLPDEQRLGKPEFCSDIYALGMVAIQALIGIHPGDLSYDKDGNPIWRDLLPTGNYYNSNFLNIIARMVRCNYRERYQSVDEVLKDLEKLNTLATSQQPIEPTYVLDSDFQQPDEKSSNLNSTKIKKMFGLIALGLSGTIVGVGAIFLVSKIPFTDKYISYENANYGIKVERPQKWLIQEEDDFINPGIIFLSPEENNADDFQEKVKLSVEQLSTPLSLKEYTEQALREIKISNSIIEQPKIVTFANREGRKVIYQGQNGRKSLEFWTIKNQKAYIITYTAEANKFKKFAKQAENIIHSLEIRG